MIRVSLKAGRGKSVEWEAVSTVADFGIDVKPEKVAALCRGCWFCFLSSESTVLLIPFSLKIIASSSNGSAGRTGFFFFPLLAVVGASKPLPWLLKTAEPTAIVATFEAAAFSFAFAGLRGGVSLAGAAGEEANRGSICDSVAEFLLVTTGISSAEPRLAAFGFTLVGAGL